VEADVVALGVLLGVLLVAGVLLWTGDEETGAEDWTVGVGRVEAWVAGAF